MLKDKLSDEYLIAVGACDVIAKKEDIEELMMLALRCNRLIIDLQELRSRSAPLPHEEVLDAED